MQFLLKLATYCDDSTVGTFLFKITSHLNFFFVRQLINKNTSDLNIMSEKNPDKELKFILKLYSMGI